MIRNAVRERQESATKHLRSDRRGVVLIVVLVLVAMLALAGFGFLADMTTEYEAARINGDLLQAHQTMASAETLLLEITRQQATLPISIETLSDNPDLFQSRVVPPVNPFGESSGEFSIDVGNSEDWRFAVLHGLPNNAAAATAAVDDGALEDPFGGGLQHPLTFGLQNESDKLHLGRVLAWEVANPGDGSSALMQIPGMTNEAADSILDWMDPDDRPRQFGAEDGYYQRLEQPYHARNSLPHSMEELLFVKGVQRESFYGTLGASDRSDAQESTAWSTYLTIHSAERNDDSSGQPRFMLNDSVHSDSMHSSLDDFESQLAEFLEPEVARFIRLARMYGTIESAKRGVGPLDVDMAANSEVASLYQISNLADLVGSSVQLPSSSTTSRRQRLVKSPLDLAIPEGVQQFRLLEERTTTASSKVLTGRININSASEPVLHALIGDPAIASQIVQQRMTLDAAERSSTVWLLTRQIADLPVFRRIHPQITTRGDVHTAEIVVYRRIGGPFLRRKVTIDAANDPPSRVDWVDLTERGLPVSLGELEQRFEGF
ncbi:MAG: general secretion pathway protein GspK [Fuerstiella sp.]|nr:general secretion pathway protein GspK [Fuerstiella sp.]MCP4854506.1 general secretion pathway protein GspK [Fuerstiella sp.]